MEQLVLPIARSAPPSFDDFVVGRNAETVAALRAFAAGSLRETGFLLWGDAGAGKTHLLQAAVAVAAAAGAPVAAFADPGELLAVDVDTLGRRLVAVDCIDVATAPAQACLFTLYNALREAGGRLVAGSRTPLAALPMREDLRTRLGWGVVRELLPLTDAEKPAALLAHAHQRGFGLSDDVIGYLLAHGRRDMPALVATLAALDRQSLSTKRAITIPMLKVWLNRELRLER
jgi:DnaA family protein